MFVRCDFNVALTLLWRRSNETDRTTEMSAVRAAYRNDVLTVTVPKPEQMKPRAIKVQVRE